MRHRIPRGAWAKAAAVVLVSVTSLALVGADWPRFRGAGGSGVSAESGLPVKWSEDEGLAWKTELPGPGSSSAIVSAGRVFVTCYSGYGVGRGRAGNEEDLRRHVVAVDAKSGKVLWRSSVEPKLPEQSGGPGIPQHGYASSTPVADGRRVFAFFGKTGVVAYDFDGREVWRAAVSPDPQGFGGFGSASSPILHGDLLIVPASVECEAIVAFDKRTGEEKWRAPATGYRGWWGTPILLDTGDMSELVVSVPGEIWGLNPENGKLRWYAESGGQVLCTSPVASGGVVYAIYGGRGGEGAIAVRAGGRGDVSQSHVVWSGRTGSYVPSPVAYGGHLYWVPDRGGILHCIKADSGEQVFRQRLEDAGGVYASPLVADGKLYVVTRRSGTYVLDAKPEFNQLARNTFSSDDTDFNASPAVSDGRLYLRSNRYLYCVGKATP